MGFLSRLFSYVPAEERQGISLGQKPCWEISGRIDNIPDFLRMISSIFPQGSIIYIEGGPSSREIREYLEARAAKNITKIEMGTIWPRPDIYHLEINQENIEGLINIHEEISLQGIANHLHIYKDDRVLLQWYDAFTDPFYLSKDISEDIVISLCQKFNLSYADCYESDYP